MVHYLPVFGMKSIITVVLISLVLLGLFLVSVPYDISFIPGFLFLGSLGYLIFALGEYLKNKRDRTMMVSHKGMKRLQVR